MLCAACSQGGEGDITVDPTVLVADDDVNAQIIAETLLRLRGFHVRRAGDGTEASDVVRDEDIAVVVLDLDLPGLNGSELLRQIRARLAQSPLLSTPRVLAVTSRREAEVERFALRVGADAVLRKPLAPGQFIRTVERLVEQAAPQAA
jgi:CheY-like chemotaxis protein